MSKKNSRNRIIDYSLAHKKPLIIGFIFTLIRTAMEIIGPIIIGYILENLITMNMSRGDFLSIGKLLTIYLFVYLGSGVFSNLARLYFEDGATSITYNVQKDIYDHVQKLPVSYFDSLPAGSIVTRITNDTSKLKNLFQLVLTDMLTSIVIVIAMYLMLLITNFYVAILLLITGPLIYIIFNDLRKKTYKYTSRIRKYTSEINSDLNENIINMEIIQAYNREKLIKEEFTEINQNIYDNGLKMTLLRSYGGYRAMDIVRYFGSIIVLFYFGYGQINQKYPVSIGSLYIVMDYSNKIFDNLQRTVSRFGDVEQSYASASHIFDLFDLKVEEDFEIELDTSRQDVKFQDIYFAYDKEYVLKDINFEVKEGTSIALVGATGSGKSSIINLLLNFYSPNKGKVTIGGQDIHKLSRTSLRKNMSVVLQDPHLFESTIEENIRLDGDFTRQEIEEALIEVGGQNLVNRGIDTVILKSGSNLSQGEKQLVAFARSYIRNPKILVLDEATSNIDTETESIIQRGIEKLQENRTTFMVAHRLSTIQNADQILVLHQGKIVEKGNHQELLEKKGYYYGMYLDQMES